MPDPTSAPMRIALLAPAVNPRGDVVHVLELACALHALGHRVTVFAPAASGQRLFRSAPHPVELVPAPPPSGRLAELGAQRIDAFKAYLGPRFQRQPFDVYHAHDGIGGSALADLVDARVIDGFVRTVHHLDPYPDVRLARWQSRSVRRARQVLCVSRVWRDTVRREYGVGAALVSNGVDRTRFAPQPDARDAVLAARLGLRPGAPLVLGVGGIDARKNTLRVLQAFMMLRAERPDAQLVIAGGESLLDHRACVRDFYRLLSQHAITAGAGGTVVLPGIVPDDELPALYRLADVLAMPSLREGFGLAVLEALSSGTPVVVSRRPPFTEYLGDTASAGFAAYAEPLDVRSIADAMRRALEPRRAASLATRPLPVCLRHGWAQCAERHVALYRMPLAPEPAAAPAVAVSVSGSA